MLRIWVALIVMMGLAGCHRFQQSAPASSSSYTPQLRRLLIAEGGPRVESMFDAGRIGARPDTNPNATVPGFVTVGGVRITEGAERTVGVSLVLVGSASPNSAERPTTSGIIMDEEEVAALKHAIQQEIDYVSKLQKQPPQHHEFMVWRSVEGLSITVNPESNSDSFFAVSVNKPSSENVSLSLSLDAGKQLLSKADAALNLANGNE